MFVLVLAAACGWFLWSRRQAERRRFQALMVLGAGVRSPPDEPQPDMPFAARGYAGIATLRLNHQQVDLYMFAKANAWHLLKSGATEHQVASSHWGGVYAIEDELDAYSDGLAAFQDAVKATSGPPEGYIGGQEREAAAGLRLSQVLAEYPEEFGRFVRAQVGA